jgi:hypothetical protein
MQTKLMSEVDDPTPKTTRINFPTTKAEMDALKARVSAEREAKRGHQNVARRRSK